MSDIEVEHRELEEAYDSAMRRLVDAEKARVLLARELDYERNERIRFQLMAENRMWTR